MIDVDLPDPDATRALAERLAPALAPGDVVALYGPLGAGKTAFARFVIQARARQEGRSIDEVPSPTFTLVQAYDSDETGGAALWHFDLYRLSAADEALELGIDEAFAGAVSLIEWPDRLGGLLPADRLDVELELGSDTRRRARISGRGARGRILEAALGRVAA